MSKLTMSGKVYRIFTMILSIFLSVLFCVLLITSPKSQLALNNPTTENDYELLEAKALDVAKSLNEDALADNSLTAEWSLTDKELIVTVASLKAKVTAKIPFSIDLLDMKDETLHVSTSLKLNDIEYIRENLLNSGSFYIYAPIVVSTCMGSFIYFMFYLWKKINY